MIRELRPDDAAAFLSLCLSLDEETSFMMLEPGERPASVDEMRQEIRRLRGTGNSVVLVAEVDGAFVGYVGAYGGEFRRNRHSAYVVAGVRSYVAGRGVGGQLFEALEAWAKSSGVTRLELTVMVHNARAISLYTRIGFRIEGTRHRSMIVDGQPVDELLMAKLLD